MITVRPIQTKQEQELLCTLCHIPYRAELLAYGAWNDQNEFSGICQFGMNAEGGHLYHLATPTENDPDDALFVMGRAALNFIDLCGVKIAYFDGEAEGMDPLLRRIGFTKNESGRYSFVVEGFFTKPCKCEH